MFLFHPRASFLKEIHVFMTVSIGNLGSEGIQWETNLQAIVM